MFLLDEASHLLILEETQNRIRDTKQKRIREEQTNGSDVSLLLCDSISISSGVDEDASIRVNHHLDNS